MASLYDEFPTVNIPQVSNEPEQNPYADWEQTVFGMPMTDFVSLTGSLAHAIAPETPQGRVGATMANYAERARTGIQGFEQARQKRMQDLSVGQGLYDIMTDTDLSEAERQRQAGSFLARQGLTEDATKYYGRSATLAGKEEARAAKAQRETEETLREARQSAEAGRIMRELAAAGEVDPQFRSLYTDIMGANLAEVDPSLYKEYVESRPKEKTYKPDYEEYVVRGRRGVYDTTSPGFQKAVAQGLVTKPRTSTTDKMTNQQRLRVDATRSLASQGIDDPTPAQVWARMRKLKVGSDMSFTEKSVMENYVPTFETTATGEMIMLPKNFWEEQSSNTLPAEVLKQAAAMGIKPFKVGEDGKPVATTWEEIGITDETLEKSTGEEVKEAIKDLFGMGDGTAESPEKTPEQAQERTMMNERPPASEHKGRVLVHEENGKITREISDGKRWIALED